MAAPKPYQKKELNDPIGQRLRAKRIALDMSISDVANITHIKPEFLTAIESLNTDALPSIGYVLGYVRSYAKALGMNGDEAVSRYKQDVAVPENLGMRDRPHFVPQRKIRLPRGFIPALTALGFGVMLTAWYGVQTETVAAPVTGTNVAAVEGPVEAAPKIDPNLVTLRTTAPSWVQIKDSSGATLVSRIFVTGETWQAPRGAGYNVSVRDAGALEIFLGEDIRPALGAPGEAVYDAVLGD